MFSLSARRQGTKEYMSFIGASYVAPRYSVKRLPASPLVRSSDSIVQTRKASSVSGSSTGENWQESLTTKTVSITKVPSRREPDPNNAIEPGASLCKAGWLACLQLLCRKES